MARKSPAIQGRQRPCTPLVSLAAYREDALYPRVARAVDGLLRKGKVVAPVDVLIGMGLLAREHIEDWRRGRVPFLERAVNCNLARLSRLLRIHATHFVWPGKGPFHPPASKEGRA